jgi:hypothetical protein
MEKSVTKLPVAQDGKPDWKLMQSFVESLPFSSTTAENHFSKSEEPQAALVA